MADIQIEGSIYEGVAACLVRDGKTVAHVVEYADAVEIAAALSAHPQQDAKVAREVVRDGWTGRDRDLASRALSSPVVGDREGVREAIARAFEAGCQAVHENYQEDRDPDFTEAASDYAADAILALSASPTPSDAGLRDDAVDADLAAIGPRPAGKVLAWSEPRPCFYKNTDIGPCGYCHGCREASARAALASSPPSSEAATTTPLAGEGSIAHEFAALLSFAEECEREKLVGDEGCLWPVERARVFLTTYRAPTPRKEARQDESGWLIERESADGSPVWLETLADLGADGWTKDSIAALRFARHADASTFIDYYLGEPKDFDLRVTEHSWSAPTPSTVLDEDGDAQTNLLRMADHYKARCRQLEEELMDVRAASGDDSVNLGRFGHHPDPAIDFCEEVTCIEGMYEDHKRLGHMYNDDDTSADMATLNRRVSRAMDFKVGGDPLCVAAKDKVRVIETALKSPPRTGAE